MHPDLKNPAEPKRGVHEFNNIQQDLQRSDVTIKSVPEVNVLHLWRSRIFIKLHLEG